MSAPRLLFVDNCVASFHAYRSELAHAARDAGFDVHIACPPGRAAARLAAEGLHFHPVPMTRCGLNPLQELATILALVRLYRRLRPSLLHHLRLKPVLYGGLAARFAGTPPTVSLLTGLGHLFTAHSPRTAVLRALLTRGLRFAFRRPAQTVIFQNPDDQAVFLQARIVSPRQTALIRGSGVDPAVFHPTSEPPAPVLVVLPSRMIREKGIAAFVDAAARLQARGVAARFALVGGPDPGSPAGISLDQLHAWHRAGAVEYWGPHTDMRAVYARAHIVCLPSLREGVPKALIEAAACGKPIVATDVPGCREIVSHAKNGLLVPPGDVPALADALALLIGNPPLRARMGSHSRELVLAEFSLARVIAATLAVYQSLLAPSAAPHCGRAYPLFKRALDCVVSAAALFLLAPLFAAVALAIKAGSPGPVFYRGERAGLRGAPFRIFKFRSMVVNAESLGGSCTASGDPRVTPVGAVLRRYKLDELPQFLNVLAGSMSLVGPRPEVRKYVDLYSGGEKAILSLKPGITDWASLWNSDEGAVLEGAADPERAYEELIRPTKLTLQLLYLRHRSFPTDLRILLYTPVRLLRPGWTPRELAPYGRLQSYKALHQDA